MLTIRLAEHVIRIENQYPYLESLCRDYLTPAEPAYTICITPEQLAAENRDGGNWPPGYLESLAVYRRICELLLPQDIVLFHCSALMLDGRAYLFTAPSGTGKSTHTRLWRETFGDRVTMINDDKPLLHIGAQVTAYGTPYGGKDGLQRNLSAPAAGIVLLHQAPENTIRPLTEREAFPALLNQTYRPEGAEAVFRVMELVKRLCRLPVFDMGCTISQEAVMLAACALTGGEL